MKQQIILALSGIFFILAGLLTAFVYLIAGLPVGYLIGAILAAIAGITCMVINAVRSYRAFAAPSAPASPDAVVDATRASSILERNNGLINDWKKVQETRGKLKMLKMAAETEEDSSGS